MSGHDLEQAIEANATGPRKVTGDSGSVEQHSIQDQIEAEKFLAAKRAGKKQGLGIKLMKIRPGGTV